MKASKPKVVLPTHPRNFNIDQAGIMFDDRRAAAQELHGDVALVRGPALPAHAIQLCLGCPRLLAHRRASAMGRRSKRQVSIQILRDFFRFPLPAALLGQGRLS